ncbi:MAG: hypothetical protein ACQEVD_04075 [Actinomycetota bacterium]
MPIHVQQDLTPELAMLIFESGRCAVDTETSGLDWREDRLEICQISTPNADPVIVRNSGYRPPLLATVLESTDVESVYHFAPFDLRFLEQNWQIRTRNVRCTKTASRVADPTMPNYAHSLKPLLARRLGIELEKGSVRTSDWGAPELSPEQIDYAVSDVQHLLELHDNIVSGFNSDDLGLYGALCAYLPTDAHREIVGIPNPLVH